MIGPDERPDLSGVPSSLSGAPQAPTRPGRLGQASQFRSTLRIAVWLSAAAIIGLAAAFVAYRIPALFGPVAASIAK